MEKRIKEKIIKYGTPLSQWNLSINYGIKTGLNDAFIIDQQTKEKLIAEDPRSAEIIRPILRGKDIKRYGYDFKQTYLIVTHNGNKIKGILPVNINDYPAVKKHLEKYLDKLEKRQDRGDTPYNLRNCVYMDEFSKPKIIFKEMSESPSFCYDEKKHFVCLDTARILTGQHLKYLLGILNSKLFFYSVAKYYGGGKLGEAGIRMKHTFFIQFPCVLPSKDFENKICSFVDEILSSGENKENITTAIDEALFDAYNLNDEEKNAIRKSFQF